MTHIKLTALVPITTLSLLCSGLNAQESINPDDSILSATPPSYIDSPDSSWFTPENFGLGVSTGTLGLSLQASYEFTDWFYVKAQIGGLPLSASQEVDGTDYNLDVNLFSGGVTANFLPFHSTRAIRGFRVSVGAYGVDNSIGLDASSPGQEITLGDTASFILGQGDRLSGDIAFSGFAPYVGIGWDFELGDEDQFLLSFDVGALFTGSPSVSLRPEGTFTDFATQNPGVVLQDEIDNEVAEIRDDTDQVEVYPVFSTSFTWKF